jgi:hypothetical protein
LDTDELSEAVPPTITDPATVAPEEGDVIETLGFVVSDVLEQFALRGLQRVAAGAALARKAIDAAISAVINMDLPIIVPTLPSPEWN